MNLKKINANEAHDSLATTNPKTSAIRDAHPRFPKRVGMPNAKESAVYRATDRITEAIDLATRGLEDEVFFAVFENVATHCVMRTAFRTNKAWVREWNSKLPKHGSSARAKNDENS
jgi:hypothetical protein